LDNTLDELADLIGRLKALSNPPVVLVGGNALGSSPDTQIALGADFAASSIEDALQLTQKTLPAEKHSPRLMDR
jgi:predicted NBD/HSP70 family sugar kinase